MNPLRWPAAPVVRLPVGIQIVARSYDDVRPFRTADAFERVASWFDVAERRPAL